MAVNKERETSNNNTDKTVEIMMSFQFDSPVLTRLTIQSDDETDMHTQIEEIPKNRQDNININPDITDTKSLKMPNTLGPDEIVSMFWENIDGCPKRDIPIEIMCFDVEENEDKTDTNNEQDEARENTVFEPRPKRRKSITPKSSSNRDQKTESFGVVDEVTKKTYVSYLNQISAEMETKNSGRKVTKNEKRQFPRTKVTSRREVKKFPGKMDSMRKHGEETTKIVNESKSVENNLNDIPIILNMPSNKTNMKTHGTIAKLNDSTRRQLENENITKKNIHTNEDTVANEYVPRTASVPKATATNIAENANLEKTFGPHLYKMLEKISDTLLTLFPLINNYAMATQTRPVNENDVKEASIQLKNSKTQCFNIMHSWIKTLILPFKEDLEYMKAFLLLTSRMAKERRLESFSLENLKLLCAEMINWTEHAIRSNKELRLKQIMEWRNNHQQLINQRCETDQFPRQHQSQIQNPTLTSMLAKGQTQFESTKASLPQAQKGQQQNNNYPYESFEQTTGLHRAYNVYNSESSCRHEYNANNADCNAQNQQNTYQHYQNGKNNISELACLGLLVNGKNYHGVTNSNCANNQYATSGRPKELSILRLGTAQASVCNVTSLPVNSQIQNPPWLNVNTSSVVPNLNQPAYPPPPYSAGVPEKNPCNPLKQKRRMSSHQKSYSEIQIQQQGVQVYDPNRAICAITPTQQRSLSRDSGIMTPTHDQMDLPNADSYAPSSGEGAVSSFSPMITHVTSTSTPADPKRSSCSVCGTVTNLTCMQCSSIYYCTVQCQASDWTIHRLLCTKKT